MSQIQSNLSSGWTQLRSYLQAELLKENAFLLPLRLFIGLGWLRAGVDGTRQIANITVILAHGIEGDVGFS